MNSKHKTFFFKLISICFGLLIGLFLAECGFRYYLYGPAGLSYTQLNSFKALGISGLVQRAENDSILWEIKPDLDTVFKFSHFSTNSLGMRDKEYPKAKPKNTKRIVVIGDSFAMGSGVSDTENYPAVLENLLAETYKDTNIEVLNFGVGGYGLRNYVAVLNEKAMSFDPDLILIGFCGGNDFLLPRKQHIEAQLKLRPPVEMFYRSHLRKFFRDNKLKELKKRFEVPIPSENQRTYMSAHFQAIKKQAETKNIPVMVAYYSLVATPKVISYMKEFVTAQDIHFVNAEHTLEDIPVKDRMFHPLDGHPNAWVHSIYAKNIYRYISDMKLLEIDIH